MAKNITKKSVNIFTTIFVTIILVLSATGSAVAQGKKTSRTPTVEEITKALKEMGIAQGNLQYVKSANTTDKSWGSYLYRVSQDKMQLPLVVFVNKVSKELVIGILVKDRKIVAPKLSAEDLQPKLNPVDISGISTNNRIVYNDKGTRTIYMFADPDCSYCQQTEEKLKTYRGQYKVVVKHFPLEPIHPNAKNNAIQRQKDWLKSKGYDAETALNMAKNIVEQDMIEGYKIGINGTPTFIDDEGNILLQGIPDWETNN